MIGFKRNLKRCVICKRVFKPDGSNQKVCSEGCRKVFYELQGKNYEYQKGYRRAVLYNFNPRVKATHLDEVVAEAKMANKSYGYYVGEKYLAATKDIPMLRKYGDECSFVQYTDGISVFFVRPASQRLGACIMEERLNGFCLMKRAHSFKNREFETLKTAQKALDEYARDNHLHEYFDEGVKEV